MTADDIERIELHGFSDASLQAYGTCIYVCTVFEMKEVKTNLFNTKSRVASLKEMSIPRLELLWNLILARLMCAMENTLKTVMYISRKFYYPDSKFTLSCIKFLDKEFKTFAENVLKEYENFQIRRTGISSEHHKIQLKF